MFIFRKSRSFILILTVLALVVVLSFYSIESPSGNEMDSDPKENSLFHDLSYEHTFGESSEETIHRFLDTTEHLGQSIKDVTKELASLEHEEEHLEPCTIVNPFTNQFYDLRPLGALGLEGEVQAWNAKGFDYGHNFSIGICHTPLKQLKTLKDIDFNNSNNKTNVGAYYTNDSDNSKVSIGQVSTDLRFRGKKLVLEYTDGDQCDNLLDGNSQPLHKSTLLSFTCDREMMAKARVSYLGSFNNCSYHFEVRTIHACATANDANDSAVWVIFLGVILAAIVVYFGANKVYSLTKYHYESKMAKRDVEMGYRD